LEVIIVVWLTGLSSAGKTTLGEKVVRALGDLGYRAELLDGDVVRQHLCRDLGFSKADRDENVKRVAFVAGLLARNGIVTVVALIAPYRDTRDQVRSRTPGFVEVYINAPVAVCEKRDVKGLYRKARSGELQGFTGVSDPYEPPVNPEVECRTDLETIHQSASKILAYLMPHLQSQAAFRIPRSLDIPTSEVLNDMMP
jgi:adenylyl-sulfate kinase